MNPPTTNRLPGLDGLRAISALMVIFAHWGQHNSYFHSEFAKQFLMRGRYGVYIFFGISGFIITYTLLREEEKQGAISIRGFYLRRSLRILPPAYFYLLCLGLLAATGAIVLAQGEITAGALFFRNLVRGSIYTDHFWSLALEEQFYLIWPLLLICLPQNKRLQVVLLLCLLAPLYRKVDFWPRAAPWPRLDLMYEALLFGAVAALLWRNPKWRCKLENSGLLNGASFLALAFLLTLLFWWPSERGESLIATMRAAIIAMVILLLVAAPSPKVTAFFNATILVWIGRASYSLYVWQQLILFYPGTRGWLGNAIALVLVFVVGALSYHLIEKPAQSLRDRLCLQTSLPESRLA